MPKHIRICHIGTMILEFFLVTSTSLALGFIWFGLIKQTWDLDADPARWLTAVVVIILIEVVIFWIGIIHGDMIDLNRENIDGLDIREFYVQLVSGLREKGF